MKSWLFACALALTACEKVTAYEPSAEKRQQDLENQSLADAKALATKGDLEGAHAKLSQIALDAPARRMAEFAEIENKWAEAQIAKADAEKDNVKKLAILNEVAKASNVSPELRAKASNKIALATPDPDLPPILVNYDPAEAAANVAKAKEFLAQNKLKEAHAILAPRVFENKASPEEVSMLTALCPAVKDTQCISFLVDAGRISQQSADKMMKAPPATPGKCSTCGKGGKDGG